MRNEALVERFDQLRNKLEERRQAKREINQYRVGKAPLKGVFANGRLRFASTEDERQYRQFVEMSKLNMCPLIVDSIVDDVSLVSFSELEPEGDEAPPTVAADGTEEQAPIDVVAASRKALRRMKAQRVPSKASRIFADALHHGEGFGYVDPFSEDGPILYLDSRNVYVETDPLDPWKRTAAIVELYRYGESQELEDAELLKTFAYIVDPDSGAIHYLEMVRVDEYGALVDNPELTFDVVHTVDRVPVVPVMTPEGTGIYEPHLATIDRINFMIFSRLVITDKQSFKELWIKGLPAFIQDPETGEFKQIEWSEELLRGPGMANLLPGENADVKETGQTDFSPLTGAVFSEIKHLAALTSTPLYILDPSSAQQSALGADLADKVHRTKVRTLRASLEDCLTELMSLSFAVTGEPGKQFEAAWAPMEDESLSSRAQTVTQLKSTLPVRFLWEHILKLDPEEVAAAMAAIQEELDDPALMAYSANVDKVLMLQDRAKQEEQEMLASYLAPAESLEETPEPSVEQFSTLRSEADTDPSNFIIAYLQDHGGGAWAREVIEAGRLKGYQENALKTARTRNSDLIKSERKSNAGKVANYWTLNQARNRVGPID